MFRLFESKNHNKYQTVCRIMENIQVGALVDLSIESRIIPKITTKVILENLDFVSTKRLQVAKEAICTKQFTCFDQNGENSHATIMILAKVCQRKGEEHLNQFQICVVPKFLNFNIKYKDNKPFNGRLKLKVKCQKPNYEFDLPVFGFYNYNQNINIESDFKKDQKLPESIQLFGDIEFDFSPGQPGNWGLIPSTFNLSPNPTVQPFEFTMKSNGKKWHFDGHFLCKLSPVFKAMLENEDTIEAQEKQVDIENVPETILDLFHKLASRWTKCGCIVYEICLNFKCPNCQEDNFNEELNLETIGELLTFADRYLMQALIDVCINILTKNLDVDNVLDVLLLGYFLNNEKLLKISTIFMMNASKDDKVSDEKKLEWKKFISDNPNCISHMMSSMILS